MKPVNEPFTSADVCTMTPDEITTHWIARQRAARDAGQAHYAILRESTKRGEIVATIDGGD